MEQTVIMWVTVLGFAIVVTRAVFHQAQALLAAPLIAQIATLSESIKDFAKAVQALKDEIVNLRERVAKNEASTKSAHLRIDEIKEMLNHDE